MKRSLMFLVLAVALFPLSSHAAEDIHREKSLYRNIVVREAGNRRCLVFAVKRGDRNQTCIDMDHPRRLVFAYVRMSLAGLLLDPQPRHILVVGLGGGSIPMTLSELYPEARIDVVEIDEAVERVAKEYFQFNETDNMKVTIADARVFVKRSEIARRQYDFIVLDAFTGDYIPEHLMTREFLEEVKAIMTDDGVLVSNTFSTSALYDHESVTYRDVFGPFFNFKMPTTGNRVIIASGSGLPSDEIIKARAEVFSARLDPYGVKIEDYPAYMDRGVDWDTTRRPLTDQYAPANLLNSEGD